LKTLRKFGDFQAEYRLPPTLSGCSSPLLQIANSNLRWLRVWDLNLRRFGPYDRAPRAQLSIRRDRRNYDPSIAGLGTDKAQRYFASDLIGFRLCDATEIAVVEVVAGSAQHRGTARAQPVQQCSTGSRKDPTKAKYVKKP
jgi:hypothetical protein